MTGELRIPDSILPAIRRMAALISRSDARRSATGT
jgi:hypothetical protein